MNREELFTELQAAWDATPRNSKNDLFTALFSVAPENAQAVMDWLEDNGIPAHLGEPSPQGLWYQYQGESTRRQREAAEEHQRLQAREILTEAATMAAEAAGEDLPAEHYQKATADILSRLETLRDDLTEGKKKEPLTPDNLTDFGNTHGYSLDFLGGLTIPSPGITIIGGKAASGKTTALINAARSLLREGASVALFSYEQTKQDIALALALSITAQNGTEKIQHPDFHGPRERVTLPNTETITANSDSITNDFHNSLKRHIQEHGIPDFLKPAYEEIRNHIAAGKLELWDYYGNAAELTKRIERTSFDVYIVDYIQVIPPAAGDAKEGYQRIADLAKYFRGLSSTGGKTIIAGAQFNREKDKDRPGDFDPTMEIFREAADIEHLAALALGLGWYKDRQGKSVFFWKVLKHRYNGEARDARLYSGGEFKFFYAQQFSDWVTPNNTHWPPAWAPERGSIGREATREQKKKHDADTNTVKSGDVI